MGLFRKIKTAATSPSALTESEIQKKLYGDFTAQAPHVLIGERDHFKEAGPYQPPLPKTPSDKEQAKDLFSVGSESATELHPAPYSEEENAEPSPRYVPLHDFESRIASQTPASSGPDASSRFFYNRPELSKMASFAALFKNVLSSKPEILKKILLWGGVVLIVFLLFWGVNALNAQREMAMHTNYSVAGVTPAESVKVQVPITSEPPVVTTSAPVGSPASGSREAAIPAAPVQPKAYYVIQVVTYPTKEDADKIVLSLRKAGIRAYVKESTRPSGRLFYIVLIRGGRTQEEAKAQLLKFKANEVARPFQDAFVKSSRT